MWTKFFLSSSRICFRVVDSRSVTLFCFYVGRSKTPKIFTPANFFLQIAIIFYPFFFQKTPKMPEKIKLAIVPIMMLFIAIKATLMRFSSVFVKTHARKIFFRSSSKLDDFPLKTASGLVFNNNLCF